MQKQTNFNKQLASFLNNCTILSYDDEQIQLVTNNKRIILNKQQNNKLQIILQTNIDANIVTVNTTKQINK